MAAFNLTGQGMQRNAVLRLLSGPWPCRTALRLCSGLWACRTEVGLFTKPSIMEKKNRKKRS